MTARPSVPGRQRGLAYVEAMVALMLVMVALVPAMNALQGALIGSQVLADAASRDSQLRAKMEEVLSKPFGVLNAETYLAGANTTSAVSASLSDPAGPTRRIVILYRTDGSAVTTGDVGLLRVRVAWESGGALALETLRSKWF